MDVLDRELAFAGFDRGGLDRFFDVGEGEFVGVAQDRDDQAFFGADRDAEVDVGRGDDVGAVDLAVDERVFLQGEDGGGAEDRHKAEADAVLLFEFLFEAFAQGHGRGHVDFIEGGQDRGGVLGLDQALGDALAQGGHALARDRAFSGLRGRGLVGGEGAAGGGGRGLLHGRGCCGSGGRGIRGGGEDVALGDAAVLAGAGDRRGVDLGVGGEFLHRGAVVFRVLGGGCRRGGDLGRAGFGGFGGGGVRAAGVGGGGGGDVGGGVDDRDQAADRDGVASGDLEADLTVETGLDFRADLCRFRVRRAGSIPRRWRRQRPASGQDALGDGFADGGDDDLMYGMFSVNLGAGLGG